MNLTLIQTVPDLPELPEDHRSIMTVFLVRNGRNKYWTFHCPFCTQKICELDGTIVHIRDVSNDTESQPPLLVRCPGTNKKWCRYWFAFQLLN